LIAISLMCRSRWSSLDPMGKYALLIFKADRTPVASGDKNKCTSEENAALVQGSNSHFGKYTIDAANQVLTFKIEDASFPNWNRNTQKRAYQYKDDQLKYLVTNTTQGGDAVTAEVIWEEEPGTTGNN
jgi:hypothetical protein